MDNSKPGQTPTRLENQLQQMYRSTPPDPAFTGSLENKLLSRLEQQPASFNNRWQAFIRRITPGLPVVAWSAAVVLLAVIMVWSINHLVVLPAQTPAATSSAEPENVYPIGQAAKLNGTRWVLASIPGREVLKDPQITLNFGENEASGSAGCNNYQWTYSVPPDDPKAVRFEITVQLCTGPQGIMEQERAYTDALQKTVSYRRTGERLELLDGSGAVMLAFLPSSGVSQPAGPFGIYLLTGEKTVSEIFQPGLDLNALPLQEQPFISQDDIVSYNPATYEMQITPEALERLNAFKVPVNGVPFVVCVGDERIYAGAFWTSLSSLYFDRGVVVDVTFPWQTGILRFHLGYPAPDLFRGEDRRSDPRILDVLSAAGKIPAGSILLTPTPFSSAAPLGEVPPLPQGAAVLDHAESVSPDGRWKAEMTYAVVEGSSKPGYVRLVVYAAGAGLVWMPIEEQMEQIQPEYFPDQFRWSPDGTALVYYSRGAGTGCAPFGLEKDLHRLDLDSGRIEELSPIRAGLAMRMTVSPDAHTLAYFPPDNVPLIILRDLQTGEETPVAFTPSGEYWIPGAIAWSPGGSLLAFSLLENGCPVGANQRTSIILVRTAEKDAFPLKQAVDGLTGSFDWQDAQNLTLRYQDGTFQRVDVMSVLP